MTITMSMLLLVFFPTRLACGVLTVQKVTQKHVQMAPHGARMLFPANPDLADILGDTDFDFDNLYFLHNFPSWTNRPPLPLSTLDRQLGIFLQPGLPVGFLQSRKDIG